MAWGWAPVQKRWRGNERVWQGRRSGNCDGMLLMQLCSCCLPSQTNPAATVCCCTAAVAAAATALDSQALYSGLSTSKDHFMAATQSFPVSKLPVPLPFSQFKHWTVVRLWPLYVLSAALLNTLPHSRPFKQPFPTYQRWVLLSAGFCSSWVHLDSCAVCQGL
jgi:hypothetical protein